MLVIPNRERVVAVMLALALAGGLLTLALLAKPSQAQAPTEKYNDWEPVSFVTTNECAAELISIEGAVHVVGHFTQTEDGTVHSQGHSNFVGKGVGLTSGAEYVVIERQNTNGNIHDFEDSQAPANFTGTYTVRVMRKGSATPEDDFRLTFREHITINANGEVTSQFIEDSVECY